MGASQAAKEEVTIISSDSEPLPRQKIRRVTQKVSFSHPLAHLDPHFFEATTVREPATDPDQ